MSVGTGVSIVIITRNRREGLLSKRSRLSPLLESGEAEEVLVVDNGSTDGTEGAVRELFPAIVLLPQPENLVGAFTAAKG